MKLQELVDRAIANVKASGATHKDSDAYAQHVAVEMYGIMIADLTTDRRPPSTEQGLKGALWAFQYAHDFTCTCAKDNELRFELKRRIFDINCKIEQL